MISIGYLLYIVLVEMNKIKLLQGQVRNSNIDTNNEHSRFYEDKKYDHTILRHMPPEIRMDIAIRGNIFGQFIDMSLEIFEMISYYRRKRKVLSYQRVEENQKDDEKVTKYMKFYADITSQIDIVIDGKIIQYLFAILPY